MTDADETLIYVGELLTGDGEPATVSNEPPDAVDVTPLPVNGPRTGNNGPGATSRPPLSLRRDSLSEEVIGPDLQEMRSIEFAGAELSGVYELFHDEPYHVDLPGNHASFLKDLVPLPGRDLSLALRMTF